MLYVVWAITLTRGMLLPDFLGFLKGLDAICILAYFIHRACVPCHLILRFFSTHTVGALVFMFSSCDGGTRWCAGSGQHRLGLNHKQRFSIVKVWSMFEGTWNWLRSAKGFLAIAGASLLGKNHQWNNKNRICFHIVQGCVFMCVLRAGPSACALLPGWESTTGLSSRNCMSLGCNFIWFCSIMSWYFHSGRFCSFLVGT